MPKTRAVLFGLGFLAGLLAAAGAVLVGVALAEKEIAVWHIEYECEQP